MFGSLLAVGGHISKTLEAHGYDVLSTDKYDYGYGKSGINFFDFDKSGFGQFDYDIVTNPPYRYAAEFIAQALNLVKNGRKVIMLLKLQFLEGKKRRELFKQYPPKRIWVSSSRILCAKDGDFETAIANGGSSMAYAWFVWEKGFKGDPTLKWFN